MIGRGIGALWRSIHPSQWLGNLVVFAPLVFSAHLFESARMLRVSAGFLLLCGLSGASYLVNDFLDRQHPVRQRRPLAAGELPVRGALLAAAVLAILSLAGAYLLEPAFGLAATGYLLLVLAYSLVLRRRPVLDVVAIAASLVVRAVGGAVLADVKISPWLYVGIGGVGLILALGRIQHEMRLAEAAGVPESEKYTHEAVEWMNRLAITFTLFVYCLYTFLAAPFGGNYAMMTTIPFAIYAAFRYRYLIYNRAGEKSPERLVLSDVPLMVDLGLWALAAAIVRNLVL
jgi:4-hydroxybenzoate polyprenyltransferase